ncbi:ABC transporter substrate-binding protein [Saxibacter everestensis]|uniref:ABC transporter substrate-binding protein n=1 Tax=Saxibacter everestensis TaxID=2909229 RepID=A0ABY8QQR9_9MICO|nr:ABC transporter substrate-binding protein [Brevibacteriaceae bacterium ZFBP1038]
MPLVPTPTSGSRGKRAVIRAAGGAAATIAVLALVACGGANTAKPASGDKPQKGGTLRVAYDSDPKCLDGQQVGNNTALNVSRQVVDSLTDQDPKSGKITPWLAKSWEVSDDSTSFTFALRDDVKFSDGTAFNAESVKANFENIVDLGAKSTLGSTYLAGLDTIETPDDSTVAVTFAKPNAQFLQATSTMTLGIYANATLQVSPEQRCEGEVIGSGPFTLESFTHNQSVKLKRNDDYNWPSELSDHEGAAYLDGIDISITPEASVRNGSLISGQVDLDTAVQAQDEANLEAGDFPVISRANPGVVYNLFANESKPIGGDLRVRQAINKGINRQELASVLSAHQAPASSALAKSTPLYQDQSEALVFDPDGAKALLEEAGWTEGSDGIREKNGKKLSVKVTYWQDAPFLELVQQQLRQIGFDLKLDKTTIDEVSSLQQTGEFEFQFYNLTRADPDIVRTVFHAGGRNVNYRKPGKVDELLDQSQGTLDQDKRRKLVAEATSLLIRDGHSIPLVELSGVVATAKNVHGFRFEASSRFQFYDTWLAAK